MIFGNFDRTDCCMSGLLAWLFCIAPASPRGDFAEVKKIDYAHRRLHEKTFPCRKTPWQALRQLWKRATA